MSDKKQEKNQTLTLEDLEQSRGDGHEVGGIVTGIPPEENTAEGDVEDDTTASDGVTQREKERANP